MIEDTIAKIEQRLRSDPSMSAEKRLEMESLLTELRREAAPLNLPIPDRTVPDEPRGAIDSLAADLTGFETTHPRLVGLVNRISIVLANMGI